MTYELESHSCPNCDHKQSSLSELNKVKARQVLHGQAISELRGATVCDAAEVK